MASNVFLICGYGTSKDILRDENQSFYLKMVFNAIYGVASKSKQERNYVIFSGGKTDCFKPYKRIESEEMMKFFRVYMASKSYLKDFINKLTFLTEDRAISSLENLLFTKDLLEKKKVVSRLYIFCEKTRDKRMKILAKKIFKEGKVLIMPIDFDVSSNRYLDIAFIHKKEKRALAFDLWALESSDNFKKHHNIYQKRLVYLRKAGSANHVEAVRKWCEEEVDKVLP